MIHSSGFHHICNIKSRLDCCYSPQNIFNAKKFNPHKIPISLLNVPICIQGMQRTWWPEAGTIIVTGLYCYIITYAKICIRGSRHPGFRWPRKVLCYDIFSYGDDSVQERLNKSGTSDAVIKWNLFPCYWPFVRGIHRSPVNSLHNGQWRGDLIFFYMCLNKRLSEYSLGWWFETPSRPLRRYNNAHSVVVLLSRP